MENVTFHRPFVNYKIYKSFLIPLWICYNWIFYNEMLYSSKSRISFECCPTPFHITCFNLEIYVKKYFTCTKHIIDCHLYHLRMF